MKKNLFVFMGVSILLAMTLLASGCKGGGTDGTSTPIPTSTPTPTSTPLPTGNAVVMEGVQFKPAALRVEVGTTVTWTNKDLFEHTVTPVDKTQWGSEGSGDNVSQWLKQSETWSFTFTKAGTYKYFCIPHSYKNSQGEYVGMVGEIIVVDVVSSVTHVDASK